MRIDRCKGCGEQVDIASDHKPGCTRDLERDPDRDLAMVDDYAGRRVSASMAEVLAAHQVEGRGMTYGSPDTCLCGAKTYAERGDEDVTVRRTRAFAAHQAEVLAANGYGKLPEPVTEWGAAFRVTGAMYNVYRTREEAEAFVNSMNEVDADMVVITRQRTPATHTEWEAK